MNEIPKKSPPTREDVSIALTGLAHDDGCVDEWRDEGSLAYRPYLALILFCWAL